MAYHVYGFAEGAVSTEKYIQTNIWSPYPSALAESNSALSMKLKFCDIHLTEDGCDTEFHDGTVIGAFPHYDNHHYHVVAYQCGYGDDLLKYCREHEFCHSFLAERILGSVSDVLWKLAKREPPDYRHAVYEEAFVQTFQAYLRANQRPIIGDCDWGALKGDALALLANWE